MKEQRLIEAIQGLIRHLDAADLLNRELRAIIRDWETEPIACENPLKADLDTAKAEVERLRQENESLWKATSVEALDLVNDNARLREASNALLEIVEGISNKRWECNGIRLKDTREWCAFYVACKQALAGKEGE